MSEPSTGTPSAVERGPRALPEIAGLIVLAALAFAAIVGVLAVLDTESRPAGFAVGVGIALLIFLAGGTIACGLACLGRARMEVLALGGIVAGCLFIDLLVLAIWLDIDSETYGKLVGVAFVWSFFTLLVLGLALAIGRPERVALALYTAAIASAVAGAAIATWLVATAGSDDTIGVGGGAPFGAPLPVGDDALLEVLGAMLVLLSAFWFGALAASRLPDQTLKRTFTTSPSSTT